MRRKKQKGSKHGLKPIIVFCIAVLFLIGVSLTIKLVALIKATRFTDSHSFYLELSKSSNPSDGFEIIDFAVDRQGVSILNVDVKKNFHVVNNAGEIIGIPIDARVIFNNLQDYDNFAKNTKIDSKMFYMLSHDNYKYTDLTFVDLFRLWMYSLGVKSDNIIVRRIEIPISQDIVDQMDALMFTDYSLSLEKESIQIVNGTNVSGLASRMARVIANIGGNVVMVSSSAEKTAASSISYFGKRTYTVNRLHDLFGYKLIKLSKPGISDIIINIGSDGANTHNF